jgi:Putative sensor
MTAVLLTPVPAVAASTPRRLRLGNPVSLLFSAAPWASAAYLASYLVCGVVYFGLALVLLVVGSVLSITWIGLPLLVAALLVTRGLAAAERGRARTVGVRLRAPRRRPVAGPGLRAGLAARFGDASTWREMLVLVVLWPYLLALDLIGVLVWLSGWFLISLPFWYSHIHQRFDNGTTGHGLAFGWYPDGPHGTRRYGFYIGDLHSALGAAGIGVLLVLLVGNYVVVAFARTHVASVGRLLDGH